MAFMYAGPSSCVSFMRTPHGWPEILVFVHQFRPFSSEPGLMFCFFVLFPVFMQVLSALDILQPPHIDFFQEMCVSWSSDFHATDRFELCEAKRRCFFVLAALGSVRIHSPRCLLTRKHERLENIGVSSFSGVETTGPWVGQLLVDGVRCSMSNEESVGGGGGGGVSSNLLLLPSSYFSVRQRPGRGNRVELVLEEVLNAIAVGRRVDF